MAQFWTDEITPLEPKRQSRWMIYLGSAGSSVKPYVCKTVGKPKFTQGEAEHNYLGHTYYFPGNIKWETLDVTMVDPLDPNSSSSKALLDIIEASGYHPLGNEQDIAFITKQAAMANLGKVQIVQIDSNNSPLETWTLHNAWIKDVAMGELDYKSDDLVEVKLTLRYDWASVKFKAPTGTVNSHRLRLVEK